MKYYLLLMLYTVVGKSLYTFGNWPIKIKMWEILKDVETCSSKGTCISSLSRFGKDCATSKKEALCWQDNPQEVGLLCDRVFVSGSVRFLKTGRRWSVPGSSRLGRSLWKSTSSGRATAMVRRKWEEGGCPKWCHNNSCYCDTVPAASVWRQQLGVE